MQVTCPPQYREFSWRGKTYQATPTGIADIESGPSGDIYVEKYGIMHRFEPKEYPPRHNYMQGEYSSICRDFMRGDMTSAKVRVKEMFEKPFDIEVPKSGNKVKKNRLTIENALLDNHTLEELARSAGCDDFVLHNPTKTTINMLVARGVCGSKVVFFPTKREKRDKTPYRVEFLRYVSRMRSFMDKIGYEYVECDEGSSRRSLFYYGGFSGVTHLHHKNFLSLELSPYAHKASGRVFDSISDTPQAVRYRLTLRKDNITQYKYGHYPKTGTYYRYQPDLVAKAYGRDEGKWGLYGILTSLPLSEFSRYTTDTNVDVVRHSIMLDAIALPVATARAARRIVAQMVNGRTVSEVTTALQRYPLLNKSVQRFRQTRFYCFRHTGYILDSGERVFLKLDPDVPNPDLVYRKMKFRRVLTDADVDLVLAVDAYGKLTYRGRVCRVLWHKIDPFHFDIAPMTDLVDYSSRYAFYYDMRLHTRPVPESEL